MAAAILRFIKQKNMSQDLSCFEGSTKFIIFRNTKYQFHDSKLILGVSNMRCGKNGQRNRWYKVWILNCLFNVSTIKC